MSSDTFRKKQKIAWSYHKNTSRWTYNTLEPEGHHFQSAPKEYPLRPFFELPEPVPIETGLSELMERRFSCRCFRKTPVELVSLSTLLHGAYGITGRSVFGQLEFLERAVPSAGGLYPLEFYLLVRNVSGLPPGVYHYAVIGHGLEQLREVLIPRPLSNYLFMGQHYLTDAGLILVITAEVQRNFAKYADRGYRYVLFEAGHCAQNLNLAGCALGLGTCNIGGFFDEELADLLMIDTELEIPLYGIAVGVPEEGSKNELRAVLEG